MEIRDDNVYNRCPRCGKEIHVNLEDVFRDGKADLFGTAVFCQRCSAQLLKARV